MAKNENDNNQRAQERIISLCSNRLGAVPNSVTFKVKSVDIRNMLEEYIKSKGVDLRADYGAVVLPLLLNPNVKEDNLDRSLKFGLAIPRKKEKKIKCNDSLYQLIGDNVRYLEHGAEYQLLTDSKLTSAIAGLVKSNRNSKLVVRKLGECIRNNKYNNRIFIEFDTSTVLGLLFDVNNAPSNGCEMRLNIVKVQSSKEPWKFNLVIGKYVEQKQFKQLKGDPLSGIL